MNHGDHDDMAMGGDDGPACKISMLWNWNTVDACFVSESWHVTSTGSFAGSCIAVICLVLLLELVRRSVKEFDRYLIRQHVAKFETSGAVSSTPAVAATAASAAGPSAAEAGSVASKQGGRETTVACNTVPSFRPNIWQQAVRALLHMIQFAIAYFVMLLAMYYNGYIIICIFIGAFLGSFIFQWEKLPIGGQATSAANEGTVCCG